MATEFGVGRGKVFPAGKARSLLNPMRRLVQPPRVIASRLQAATDARVLELGCGPGYFSGHLGAAVGDGRLVMFDLQREMLELARSRTARNNVAPVQGDATALPFPTASFDAVVVVLMLGEVPDRDACLAEARRVLRTSGVLMIAETRRDSDFIGFDELRQLVEPLGFEYLNRRGLRWEYTARFSAR